MILRTLLLAFLTSLVRADDIDTLIKDVLETDPNSPKQEDKRDNTDNNKPKLREFVDENGDPCFCVPYYLCVNSTILTDGSGFLDIRMGNVCQYSFEMCCKEPKDTPSLPKPQERKGCGQRRANGAGIRIIGENNEAQFGEFPWMVGLLRKTVLEGVTVVSVYQCGGALIHESVVLTTAHCITRKKYDDEIIARAGEWDTQTTNEVFAHQDRKVIRTIIHPGFNGGNLWNDFALLVLETPFKFAPNVDTVCLPAQGTTSLSRECYASGWGKDQYGKNGSYQIILRKIDLPMVPKDRCTTLIRRTRLGQYYRLHESFVCAGGIIGKDTCQGDGGSPLVCPVEGKPGTYEAVGLVAWGIGCNNETPGVYAGVAYARSWIDKTMAELGFSLE